MKSAQSEKEVESNEMLRKTKATPKEEWVKHHAWLLAIVFGVLAVMMLLAPWITLDSGSEKNYVSLWDFFGDTYQIPWGIAAGFFLSLIGIVFACFPRKSRLLVVSMLSFIVASLFDIIGKDFFVLSNPNVAGDVSLSIGLIMACCFNAIAALFSFSASSDVDAFSVSDMVECAVLIAAAEALSFGRIVKIGAGSVNLQMLPLLLLALRYGPSKAFLMCGVIYGLITCATDGYGFQGYPFDYLVGFGSVSILGFFSKEIFGKDQKGYNLKGEAFLLLGCLLATVLRFFAGSVSGTIIWETPFVDSLIANAGYIGISGAIATAAIMVAYGPLTALNARFPTKANMSE